MGDTTLIVFIIFAAITVWVVAALYFANRRRENPASKALAADRERNESRIRELETQLARVSEASTQVLETTRRQHEQRLSHIETIVCNVDAELNRKLDRVASRGALGSGSTSTHASSIAPTMLSTPAPDARPRLSPGERIAGRFVVEALLGVGGMGEVYRARDETLGETVALKVIRGLSHLDPDAIERFRREAAAARRITHPNVVRLHDIGQDGALHFLSMEYVDGESLGARIARKQNLSAAEARALALDVCDALGAAHAAGVVHRDLKPDNILVDRARKHRVIDFGVAKLPYLEGMTSTGVIVGTPEYMAPEQITGGDVDPRTDLYALGTILFEGLTGGVPFTGASAIAVGFGHCHQPIPALLGKRPDLGEPWALLLERALAKEPRERFATASEMRAAVPAA